MIIWTTGAPSVRVRQDIAKLMLMLNAVVGKLLSSKSWSAGTSSSSPFPKFLMPFPPAARIGKLVRAYGKLGNSLKLYSLMNGRDDGKVLWRRSRHGARRQQEKRIGRVLLFEII